MLAFIKENERSGGDKEDDRNRNRRKRASHSMKRSFLLANIDQIMRAPYGGVFVEALIQTKL